MNTCIVVFLPILTPPGKGKGMKNFAKMPLAIKPHGNHHHNELAWHLLYLF